MSNINFTSHPKSGMLLIRILSLAVLLSASVAMFAQTNTVKHRNTEGQIKVQNQVMRYVSLFSLDEQQAQIFTQTFRDYSKQMHIIHNKYYMPKPEPNVVLTDEEVEKRILQTFAQSREILDVREKYYTEFRKVLTPSQINTIFEDEKTRRSQSRQTTHK